MDTALYIIRSRPDSEGNVLAGYTEHRDSNGVSFTLLLKYAILHFRIVRSGLHLVTYLNVGNSCDKSTETTLHEISVQLFLRYSDSSKPSQSMLFIYKLARLAGIGKS